jgi:hypothetical protein
MLRGDLRGAVKYNRNGDSCVTLMLLTRRPVSVTESLVSKHPEARTPDVHNLPTYTEVPQLRPVDITIETVQHIAIDSQELRVQVDLMLQCSLVAWFPYQRSTLYSFGCDGVWMANESPPWAARALVRPTYCHRQEPWYPTNWYR